MFRASRSRVAAAVAVALFNCAATASAGDHGRQRLGLAPFEVAIGIGAAARVTMRTPAASS